MMSAFDPFRTLPFSRGLCASRRRGSCHSRLPCQPPWHRLSRWKSMSHRRTVRGDVSRFEDRIHPRRCRSRGNIERGNAPRSRRTLALPSPFQGHCRRSRKSTSRAMCRACGSWCTGQSRYSAARPPLPWRSLHLREPKQWQLLAARPPPQVSMTETSRTPLLERPRYAAPQLDTTNEGLSAFHPFQPLGLMV